MSKETASMAGHKVLDVLDAVGTFSKFFIYTGFLLVMVWSVTTVYFGA